MDWLSDEEVKREEIAARIKAHGCPVYTGDSVRLATQSGMRAASCADEWMRYRAELKKRGISPLPLPSKGD